jgi:S1-C subfamily serine protease
MTNTSLSALSNEIAAIVDAAAPSVVQVQGRRRAVSGVVFPDDLVVTMVSAVGRSDQLQIRTHDGKAFEASLAGWDPATGIAAIKVPGLSAPALRLSDATPHVGNFTIAIARSWSNAVTASTGTVAVIGGPLRTGHRRSIEQVVRVTAPMHDGFAGGAVLGADGAAIGVATAASIRGFGVVIPAPIVARAASDVVKHGRPRRGFLGIAGQTVELDVRQRGTLGHERGLLVVGLTPDGPADKAELLVGDILFELDGHGVSSADDLLDLLTAERVGRAVAARLLRGGTITEVQVTVQERHA